MNEPRSLRALRDVGEQTLNSDFLCPFGVTSMISMTLRHDGDLKVETVFFLSLVTSMTTVEGFPSYLSR